MVPSAAEQRATTIFALEGSRIEANDFNFPLKHVWGRRNLYTFNIELGGIDIDTACGSKRRPMAPSHGPRQPQESGASGKKRMLTTCTSAGTTTYETTHRTLASTRTWRTITPSPSCNRATGDSRDPDKNPCITSSGCANPRRDTASTGRRRRRTTITDGRWRRTAGNRWWKRAARGTRWRDGLQLGGSGTSESGDATVTRSSSREGCSSAVHNGRPAPTTTNVSTSTRHSRIWRTTLECSHTWSIRTPQRTPTVRGGSNIKGNYCVFFKEAMALPEAACWKEASDKEMESLRARKIYDVVPITPILPGQKAISSR